MRLAAQASCAAVVCIFVLLTQTRHVQRPPAPRDLPHELRKRQAASDVRETLARWWG